MDESRTGRVILRFDGALCIHARNCVLRYPDIFRANTPGAWLHAEAGAPDDSLAAAKNCPSGAITVERLDGGETEVNPPVNLAFVRENGPLAMEADIRLDGRATTRRVLCRCGASKHKPLCDGSHTQAGFAATGEPKTKDSEPLAERDGPLDVEPTPNGPLHVKGNLEIVSGTGRTTDRTTEAFLCRCGASGNKPYCDGSHKKAGFQAP